MQHVLIAAVGEEPTPNLIPLFAAGVGPFDHVQLLLSDKPEVQRVAENLVSAIDKDPALAVTVAEHRDLNAWELATARNQVTKAIAYHREKGRGVTVNVTGGTKIMSLASLEAAREAGVPALYVNTEREEIIHFSPDGGQRNVPFKVRISIETQLRAAGQKITEAQNPVPASEVDRRRAEFARFLVANFKEVHGDLVSRVLACCGGKLRVPVSLVPQGNSREATLLAQAAELWKWDESAGTITVADEDAHKFLKSRWLEVFALTTLGADRRFDEVLGNVKLYGFEGEFDVVASRNGRLGVVECKAINPSPSRPVRKNTGMSFIVAKVRLHEVILGGPYAASMFVFATDAEFLDVNRERIFNQYNIPRPLFGQEIDRLSGEMLKRLTP